MYKILRVLRSLVRVTRRDPGLVVLAVRVYVLLVLARGAITVFPLRAFTYRLGAAQRETPDAQLPEPQGRYARRVAWTIQRIAPYTPTTSNCYPQGLTARWLLHRRGIPNTLYYGAAFDPGKATLRAHVWVRAGSLYVTGGATRRQFAPLTFYADEPAP
jgi:hypothetical protein